MALSRSDLKRLLDSRRSADGSELFRAFAERMVQELIEAEASFHVGAEWNERTSPRPTPRCGHGRSARRWIWRSHPATSTTSG